MARPHSQPSSVDRCLRVYTHRQLCQRQSTSCPGAAPPDSELGTQNWSGPPSSVLLFSAFQHSWPVRLGLSAFACAPSSAPLFIIQHSSFFIFNFHRPPPFVLRLPHSFFSFPFLSAAAATPLNAAANASCIRFAGGSAGCCRPSLSFCIWNNYHWVGALVVFLRPFTFPRLPNLRLPRRLLAHQRSN
jgi:hypothetical protein